MRILFINKFYYLRGGAERCLFETKRVLEARGHKVIPFAMQDERNEPTPYEKYFVSNIEFNQDHSWHTKWQILPRVIYFRQAREKLEKLLSREPVDLAHLHNIAHQISPSILDSLKKFGVPVVQTLHDYKLICPTYMMLTKDQICERCRGGNFYHAALRRCNKGSFAASLLNAVEMYVHRALGIYRRGIDLFIAPSHFIEYKLQQHGESHIPFFYLPNFIDPSQYVPRYGGDRYCLYFGRLASNKGVETLVRAMCRMRDIKLLIVGEGECQAALEGLVRQEQLSERVEFIGPLYGDALKKIIRDALFVVLPSQWYENCPFSILESFALGKPVIGSNIGGIPELIDDGVDGLLFTPYDVDDLSAKIRRLSSNPQETIVMGRNARFKIERRFNIDTYYQQLMMAYQQVL